MVPIERFELSTFSFVVRCSIQLSYIGRYYQLVSININIKNSHKATHQSLQCIFLITPINSLNCLVVIDYPVTFLNINPYCFVSKSLDRHNRESPNTMSYLIHNFIGISKYLQKSRMSFSFVPSDEENNSLFIYNLNIPYFTK